MEYMERMKRKQKCSAHFGEDDINFKECRINSVHAIPQDVFENQELDFYMETEYDVYLLRLKNNSEKRCVICPAKKGEIVYIICLLPFESKEINNCLEKIITLLKPYGYPEIHNPKEELTFELDV